MKGGPQEEGGVLVFFVCVYVSTLLHASTRTGPSTSALISRPASHLPFFLPSLPCCPLLPTPTHRPKQVLSDASSADRLLLGHCMQLAGVLITFLRQQQQQEEKGGQALLPPHLAGLLDHRAAQEEGVDEQQQGWSLREALQVCVSLEAGAAWEGGGGLHSFGVC